MAAASRRISAFERGRLGAFRVRSNPRFSTADIVGREIHFAATLDEALLDLTGSDDMKRGVVIVELRLCGAVR